MAFFKVTYAEKSRTAYVWNSGCNFSCTGCYYKLKPELNTADGTPGTNELKETLLRLGKSGGVESVHFLGGEPTNARDIGELASFSRETLGAKTHIVTNGSRKIDGSLFDSASVSIKAPSRRQYDEYVGATGKYDVLENVVDAHKSGVELSLSSVLIPGYVGPRDIEKIAEQIAAIDPEIPYHIIGYMPVPGAPWRNATPNEVADASALAKKHLKHVTSSCPKPEDFEYKSVRIL